MSRIGVKATIAVVLATVGAGAFAQSESGKPVYRCPGKPVLYTDSLSAREAKDKGCTTLEGAPITVIASPKRSAAPAGASASPRSAAGGDGAKVTPEDQRARDNDARRILEAELR